MKTMVSPSVATGATLCPVALRVQLTLDLSNRGEEDVLLELLVSELSLDVLKDGGDELGLLGLAHLGLVADPGVEDRLDLGGEGDLLLERERLVLELSGLLGEGEELLGERLDVLELSDRLDPLLDGRGVRRARGVQNVRHFL